MKLASAQRITAIAPIEGADAIETATVLGWEVVIKKGEYKVGDLCAYIQIDTIVPELPEYEFLRDRKFRVRTIKLRKQISQGLIVPLPNGVWADGDDLTEIMGVRKFEKQDNNPAKDERPPMPKKWYKKWKYLFLYKVWYRLFPSLNKPSSGPFPTNLVPKTDEERIQNMPKVLTTHAGKAFVVSYKLDGSSITIIHSKGKFTICSRNLTLHKANNDWHRVFNDTGFGKHVLELVKHYGTDDIIVQGEAIGRFNGNHHNLPKDEIRLFNIYVGGTRVNQREFIDVCVALGVPHCPLYMDVILNHTLPEMLAMSEIKDCLNPSVEAEGLVWRCVEDGTSFKVINNKYLLKNKE